MKGFRIGIIFAAALVILAFYFGWAYHGQVSTPVYNQADNAIPGDTAAEKGGQYAEQPEMQPNSDAENEAEEDLFSLESYEKSHLPLIASIKDKDIYLYGIKPKGVVLYNKGTGHYFNWDYLTPRFVLPYLSVKDYDGDGKEELAAVLYVGSGTGVSIEELHIVDINEEEILSQDPESKDYFKPNPDYFRDRFYLPEDYLSQLNKVVKLRIDKKADDIMAEITMQDNSWEMNLRKELDYIEEKALLGAKPDFGAIAGFGSDNGKLKARFGFGLRLEGYGPPQFIGYVTADVNYDGDKFTMSNYRFETAE